MTTIARMSALSLLLGLGLATTSCATRAPAGTERSDLSTSLEVRTGHGLRGTDLESQAPIPPGANLEDGFVADEAVAIALWNNAAFQSELAALGLARADLVAAGMLRNPVLSLFFPLGPKQLEAAVTWPLEPLWQRPRRIAAAELDLRRVAAGLVQNGLDLVREVKVAHADLLAAQTRQDLAQDALALHKEILQVAEARLRAGDISGLEVSLVLGEVRAAERAARRASLETRVVQEQLKSLLGLSAQDDPIEAGASAPELQVLPEFSDLLADALASRPDLRAAEISLQAAGERLGLKRRQVFDIAAVLDLNGEGKEGFEAGPGMLVELPIFNWNQAATQRAKAELEQAALHYFAVQHRITAELREAQSRYLQAAEEWSRCRDAVLPQLEETRRLTEAAYSAGDISYLAVLEASLGLLEGRREMIAVGADLRRAEADLDRGIGRSRFGE